MSSSKLRVVIAGLDSAGKTSVALKLQRGRAHMGAATTTLPTIDFNVVQWKCRGTTFNVWDVGGQDSVRPLWRHHLVGADALVYVIDSSDRLRIRKAAEELHKLMLEQGMGRACLLIFANKIDLPHVLTQEQICHELQLDELGASDWLVQPSCAHNGAGLWQGLQWLASRTASLRRSKTSPAAHSEKTACSSEFAFYG